MKKENKDLLIKDLYSRFPYKVVCEISKGKTSIIEELKSGGLKGVLDDTLSVKPYLRPMSSMTKKERIEYRRLCKKVVRKLYVADGKSWPSNKTNYRYFKTKTEYYDTYQSIDYLTSHYFDYRGLIGKKFALKATKGMYNFK